VARDAVLPPVLRGRPLENGLVVDALESWASLQAASILSGLFLVATAVLVVAVLPTLLMGDPTKRSAQERAAAGTRLDDEAPEAALAL